MSVSEAKKYCDEMQFAPGSMLPKVRACMEFVSSGENRKAVIAALYKAKEAAEGRSGTVVYG